MASNAFRNWIKNLGEKLVSGGPRRTRSAAAKRQALKNVRPRVETLEDRVVPSNWTVNALTASGAGSGLSGDLVYCINNSASGDTINFQSGLTGTINLGSYLFLGHNLTINGPGPLNGSSGIAINGATMSTRYFDVYVASGTTDTVSGLTIENGSYGTGGGVYNYEGNLTLSNDILTNNTASSYAGGGIFNYGGSVTLNADTFSDNHALGTGYGGGMMNYPVSGSVATVTNCTFFGNTAVNYGGAIFNWETMTLTSDTIAGNTATSGFGGGLFMEASGTGDNTIVSGDTGSDIYGTLSGTYILNGGVTGLSSTLAFNNGAPTETLALSPTSNAIRAGDPAQAGTTAQNGIIRPSSPDVGAYESAIPPTVTMSTANLPNNSPGMVIAGTNFDPAYANDSVTFSNGVTGNVVAATSTTLSISFTGGLGSVPLGTALDAVVTTDGLSSGSAVQVGTISTPVVYPTVTSSTASLPDISTSLTIQGTNFDPIAANNTVAFGSGVVGTVTSATSTRLTINITTPPNALGALTAIVTTDGASSGAPVPVANVVNAPTWTVTDPSGSAGSLTDITLPFAVNHALSGDTIDFANGLSGDTITLSSTLTFNHNVTLVGLGAANLTISGNNTFQGLVINSGATATISGLTLENFYCPTDTPGANFDNGGAVTVYPSATLTLNSCLVTDNAADYGGAGLMDSGTATLNDDTFSDNSADRSGGAINAYTSSTITINNCTVFDNNAGQVGGGFISLTTNVSTLQNDTIADNTAPAGAGGGIYDEGNVAMDNTIVTGNAGGDIFSTGYTLTGNYNLTGDSSGSAISGTSNLYSANADLASSLAYNNTGTTPTLALQLGSAALGTGDPGQAGSTAQNGVIRPAAPDIGSLQHTLSVTPNTANLPRNYTTLEINGTFFDPTAANDTVTFSNGVTGTVASATATSLLVDITGGLSTVPIGTALDAVVTADGVTSGSPVQVATVIAAVVPPSITSSTANLSDSSTSLTINGSNFDAIAANNTVAFNLGVVGTVASATSTQLIVTITAPPTALGALTATVTTDGNSSVPPPVQVATEVNGTWNVTNSAGTAGSGSLTNVTLPYAMAHSLGGDTITFASGLATITLSSTLTIGHNLTITGPGAANLAISGGNSIEDLVVDSMSTISGLTIENGAGGEEGGGLTNNGTLTLNEDMFQSNSSVYGGAGVFNNATLFLNDDTFTDNSAGGNANGTSTGYGGGLMNYQAGTATVANCTFFNNTALVGGGIYNWDIMTLTSDTIAGNTAGTGGGIYLTDPATGDNTIVSGDTGGDVAGDSLSGGYNLVGGVTGLASSLAYNNGAPTETLALSSTSNALSAGDPTLAGSAGQNGVIRPTPPDVGAYQSGPTVTLSTIGLPYSSTTLTIDGTDFDTNIANDSVTFNDGVTGVVTAATPTSLTVTFSGAGVSGLAGGTALDAVVTVNGTSSGSPVQVAIVVISPPVVDYSSASLPDSSTSLTIDGTNFDPIAANNTVAFNLGVQGTVTSATSTQLIVTLTAPPTSLGALTAIVTTDAQPSSPAVQVATEVNGDWIVSTTAVNGGSLSDVTLPYAVSTALSGDTISFSVTGTITLDPTLTIAANISINGPGAANLAISGNNAEQVFFVNGGVTASISGLTIENGMGTTGGGIFNDGTLTLSNAIVSGNSAGYGGAGVFNNGTLTLNDDTFAGNNAAGGYGGGLMNYQSATATVSDCTFADNTAYYAGGVFNWGSMTLTSDTIAYNTATLGGGMWQYSSATMDNTIIASNSDTDGDPDVYAADPFSSTNYVLIGNSSGFATDGGTGILLGGSANLSPTLAYNNGAPTETLALLAGSSAIGAGDPTQFGTTAQNGVVRPAVPDIGAYQTMTSGPTVTTSTANLPANASGMTIYGTGFDPTAGYDSVTFNDGAAGFIYAATSTSLSVQFSAMPTTAGPLTAVVTTDSVTSGSPVQVATVTPVVTTSTASLPNSATTVTIDGYGFDPISGNNLVSFNDGAAGTVTGATANSLTVTFTTDPTAAGPLTAVVTTDSVTSGAPVQVATVIQTSPTVTISTASLPANAATVTIDGTNFDPNPANDTVTLNDGAAGTVTGATATTLTVTFTTDPTTAGSLTAVVTADSLTSGAAVQVATVTPVVTTSSAGMLIDTPTLTIHGYGFDPIAGNNTVTFNDGAVGTVTSATSTTLVVTFTTGPTAAGSLTAVVTTDSIPSGAAVQVATVTSVTSVTVNGDYAPIVDISSNGSGTVTATTDGNNGFTAGNTVVISGYTGANAGYDGTFTVQSASGDQFTVTNATAGLPTLSGNSAGFAISQNTASALRGAQRSMVDSVVYTFTAPISLTASNFTLATSAPSVSGAPSSAPAPATLYPGMALTSLAGGSIWVVSWVSGGGTGATVSGHSLADGVYNITLGNSNEGTDTFFRLYGNVIGYNSTSHTASLNNQDSLTFTHSYLLSTGATLYLADCDYDANGVINNTDSLNFTHRYLSVWSGFVPTI